jgi:prepilin-type N-terminal cleavage/methylation domain-containing protein
VRGAPSSRRGAAGFTFIELMVVIAILALLASIVVANLDGISAPTKLRGCARAIGNEVLQLKEISGVQNRALSIEFDPANQRWRVIDAPSATEIPDPKEREQETFFGDWEEPPLGVRFEGPQFSASDVGGSGTTVVTFEGDGEVVPSGFVVFVSHERVPEEEGVTVEVSGLTGLVSYHTGRFKSEEIRKAEDF